MGGIGAARGRFVIMGDADDSYDFRRGPEVRRKAARRRMTWCRVAACPRAAARSPRRDADPASLVGKPDVLLAGAVVVQAPIHDIYCGMRGFTERLVPPSRSALHGDGIRDRDDHQGEPHAGREDRRSADHAAPDGRKAHAPHLKTFRDGWRTLRFFLMCSPRWLFLMPGAALILLGLSATRWRCPASRSPA